MLRPLVGRRVQDHFTPAPGVLFTFPSRYWFAIGLSGVFGLRMGPAVSRKISLIALLRDATRLRQAVVYGTITLYGRALSKAFPLAILLPRRGPTTPVSPRRHGFSFFRGFAPLLTESLFIFSSYGYLDVSVPHVRLPYGMAGLQPAGLPHSDIPGSRAICASPELFAAYHVLRRLREPRHPPSALAYFLSPRTYVRVDIS